MPANHMSNGKAAAALVALFLSAAIMPYLTAKDPAAAPAAAKPVAALGVGSVAGFLVQRLVSPQAKPGPEEKWQQIRETRTVVARTGDMLEVRIEEDYGPGTQPAVRTEKIVATPDLPEPLKAGAAARSGAAALAKGPDGVPHRTWVGRESVTTAAGTFDCVRVAVEIVQISSGTHLDEWYAPGLPWPVKSSSVTGAGATRYMKCELVKLERK